MSNFLSDIKKDRIDNQILIAIMATVLLLSTSVIITQLTNTVNASTNAIEDFDQDVNNTSDESAFDRDAAAAKDTSSGSNVGSDNDDNTSSGSDQTKNDNTDEPSEADALTGEQQNNNLSSSDATVALVNPNAYTYQTNPAEKSIIISGIAPAPQHINSIVKNSFGQGVADIPIQIQVKDPTDKTSTFNGKTDSSGKNQIEIPLDKAGTWTAEVTINSPSSVGGPFKDTISWEAVNPPTPPTPPTQSTLQYDSKITYPTVDISNDPRQQILTTVKYSNGTGVKDVELTIKLTNPDSQSATFSRITDAKGVDEFVTPVEKNGTWKAVVNVEDANRNIAFTKEHTWTAISNNFIPNNDNLTGPSNVTSVVTMSDFKLNIFASATPQASTTTIFGWQVKVANSLDKPIRFSNSCESNSLGYSIGGQLQTLENPLYCTGFSGPDPIILQPGGEGILKGPGDNKAFLYTTPGLKTVNLNLNYEVLDEAGQGTPGSTGDTPFSFLIQRFDPVILSDFKLNPTGHSQIPQIVPNQLYILSAKVTNNLGKPIFFHNQCFLTDLHVNPYVKYFNNPSQVGLFCDVDVVRYTKLNPGESTIAYGPEAGSHAIQFDSVGQATLTTWLAYKIDNPNANYARTNDFTYNVFVRPSSASP